MVQPAGFNNSWTDAAGHRAHGALVIRLPRRSRPKWLHVFMIHADPSAPMDQNSVLRLQLHQTIGWNMRHDLTAISASFLDP